MWKCTSCNVVNTGVVECMGCKQPAPREALFEEVPWFRRSGIMTAFILVGFVLFPPLLWTACIITLTGEVYENRVKKDGTLAKWSAGNKLAAVVVLVLQLLGLAYYFHG